MDNTTLIAFAALGLAVLYVVFPRKAKAIATVVEASRHPGHDLHDAFEACKRYAAGDELLKVIGKHGASELLSDVSKAVGTESPKA